jgi:[protein-PII] uridylyltransferase
MAGLAGTVEDLRALTLMSWADLSAVAPGVMTTWRASQLWRLYLAAYRELTRELASDRIHTAGAPAEPFLEGFPTRYLRTHDAGEVEAHLRLAEAARAAGAATLLERAGDVWRLTLVTNDRPGLFASVAGALAAWGMNIVKAEAFGNDAGAVLDTFTFADPHRTLELNPGEGDRLRAAVERVLAGRLNVRELLRDRPKPAAPHRRLAVAPAVTFDAEASPHATLIQIVAQDRPGLLHDLASAISAEGCSIDVVLADTEAHKAIDVFYVTRGGRPLDAERQARLSAALLEACSRA